jgi:hypothetical protein
MSARFFLKKLSALADRVSPLSFYDLILKPLKQRIDAGFERRYIALQRIMVGGRWGDRDLGRAQVTDGLNLPPAPARDDLQALPQGVEEGYIKRCFSKAGFFNDRHDQVMDCPFLRSSLSLASRR